MTKEKTKTYELDYSSNAFRERLNELMQEQRLEPKQLADMTGISVWTIYNYASCVNPKKVYHTTLPTGTTLWMLADQLNVSIDYLIGRSDVR